MLLTRASDGAKKAWIFSWIFAPGALPRLSKPSGALTRAISHGYELDLGRLFACSESLFVDCQHDAKGLG